MKSKLAIFDLDGTLFDTKNVNFKAYKDAIVKCGYLVDIDYNYYCEFCNGNSYKSFLPQIIPKVSLIDMQRIHEYKKVFYVKYLYEAKKNMHLFSLISQIKENYFIVLATTASRKNTDDILNYFKVKSYFDLIITQEDVSECKPSPECYLKAMVVTGIDADNTLIFEDSDSGLQAARKSGANYVKVFGYN